MAPRCPVKLAAQAVKVAREAQEWTVLDKIALLEEKIRVLKTPVVCLPSVSKPVCVAPEVPKAAVAPDASRVILPFKATRVVPVIRAEAPKAKVVVNTPKVLPKRVRTKRGCKTDAVKSLGSSRTEPCLQKSVAVAPKVTCCLSCRCTSQSLCSICVQKCACKESSYVCTGAKPASPTGTLKARA